MNNRRWAVLLGGVVIFLVGLALPAQGQGQDASADWRREWGVAAGLSLQIDTEGYHLPSAIAFVPDPGPGPQDPLYFVTELRGTVRVVTNDRSVYLFAENFFRLEPEKELPALEGEVGLAGICLAPEQGYVFVTFSYHDADGLLRNNITRFSAQPHSFSLQPSSSVAFAEIFAAYDAAPSHQIGSCRVSDNLLYVSVADGRQSDQSQKIDSVLGKVLRMTLEGHPVPTNPFFTDDGATSAADYVWAYGLRNPFGLSLVDGRVFVADNGRHVDRFLEVQPGENYLWDGSDWSIGAVADAVITPAVGPAQLEYIPRDESLFPETLQGRFVVALSAPAAAGVLVIPYGLEEHRLVAVPYDIVRYRGGGTQIVVALSLGPDGLYFAPLYPDASGRTAVFKVTYDPTQPIAAVIAGDGDAATLINDKGCLDCHSLQGEGSQRGPSLDQGLLVSHIKERVNSQAYLQSLDRVDRLDQEPYVSYRAAREEVRRATDWQKIRTWAIYHLLEPRFDNPSAQMPNQGLSKDEAELLADYLLGTGEEGMLARLLAPVRGRIPTELTLRHVLLSFGLGMVFGSVGVVGASRGLRRLKRGNTA